MAKAKAAADQPPAKKTKPEAFFQPPLPGHEHNPKEPAIIEAALAYKDTCRKRAKLSKQEKEELESLKQIMFEKGYLDIYQHGDLTIRLEKTSKPKVVVTSDKPPAKKKAKKADAESEE